MASDEVAAKAHKKHKKRDKKRDEEQPAPVTDTPDNIINGGSPLTTDTTVEPKKSKKAKRARQPEEEETADHVKVESESTDNVLQQLKKPKPSKDTAAPSSDSTPSKAETTDCVRVYCGNISFKATDQDIYDMFSRSGHILGLHWVTDKTTGQFYGSCMIDFSSKQAATTALRCNGKTLIDRVLKVSIATGIITNNNGNKQHYNSKTQPGTRVLQTQPIDTAQKPEGCHTVFLGNVSFDITDDHVTELFAGCGTITDIRWVEKDEVFKGCGFVEFEETNAVDKAVLLNGTTLLGRKMRIDYAPNK